MGLLSGAVRLRRYQVLGEADPDGVERFADAVENNAFEEFRPDDEREQAVGWVGTDDWFEPGLPPERWWVGRTVCLTVRVDTRRVPSHYLKLQCRKAEAEWRLKAGREDLTRAERDEVRAIVHRRLLERVIPSCQGVDVVWDLDRREVLVWSTAERMNETVRALFERTFGLRLRPLFPYVLAVRAVGDDRIEVLDRVVPASFRPEGDA